MRHARNGLQRKPHAAERHAPGPNAIAIAPPAYGIDAIDRGGNEPAGGGTGLPDRLKAGIERLSGLPMDDVQVHTNSSRPAGLQALAYTQGTEIHVAPGQERHLAHEAWHAVQQKQGRVRATSQISGVGLNDEGSLEKEADVMGAKANESGGSAIQRKLSAPAVQLASSASPRAPVQREKVTPNRIAEGQWAQVGHGGTVLFTALAAGCLAITAVFQGGGGAGLHMALNLPNSAQWNQFRDAVAAKKIAAIYLESDMLSQDDGWHVKIDPTSYKNQTEYSPRSAAELQAELGADYGDNGWVNAAGMVTAWFKELFGTNNVVATETNEAVAHQC